MMNRAFRIPHKLSLTQIELFTALKELFFATVSPFLSIEKQTAFLYTIT